MRRNVATFSLLLAWVCANGAIWDVAQVFAWGKMFAGYAATMSVPAALRETFDPAKPCDMCLGVAHAKQAAKQQLPPSVERTGEKFLLALHTPAALVFENNPGEWPAVAAVEAPVRSEPVPVRPPRA